MNPDTERQVARHHARLLYLIHQAEHERRTLGNLLDGHTCEQVPEESSQRELTCLSCDLEGALVEVSVLLSYAEATTSSFISYEASDRCRRLEQRRKQRQQHRQAVDNPLIVETRHRA